MNDNVRNVSGWELIAVGIAWIVVLSGAYIFARMFVEAIFG